MVLDLRGDHYDGDGVRGRRRRGGVGRRRLASAAASRSDSSPPSAPRWRCAPASAASALADFLATVAPAEGDVAGDLSRAAIEVLRGREHDAITVVTGRADASDLGSITAMTRRFARPSLVTVRAERGERWLGGQHLDGASAVAALARWHVPGGGRSNDVARAVRTAAARRLRDPARRRALRRRRGPVHRGPRPERWRLAGGAVACCSPVACGCGGSGWSCWRVRSPSWPSPLRSARSEVSAAASSMPRSTGWHRDGRRCSRHRSPPIRRRARWCRWRWSSGRRPARRSPSRTHAASGPLRPRPGCRAGPRGGRPGGRGRGRRA